MTTEKLGIVTRAGLEDRIGAVFTVIVEFPNGPSEYITSDLVWSAIPVQIVKAGELYALRDAAKNLQAKLAALEEALAPFAAAANRRDGKDDSLWRGMTDTTRIGPVTVGDFRRAAVAKEQPNV